MRTRAALAHNGETGLPRSLAPSADSVRLRAGARQSTAT
jgi:hypothetical protein